MSLWGKITGTEKAIDLAETTVKSGFHLLDEAFDTDEEKGERKIKVLDMWLHTQELIGKESTPSAMTRRVLAWGIFFLIILLLSGGVYYIETDQLAKLNSLKEWANELWIGQAFVAAWTTYFLKHVVK